MKTCKSLSAQLLWKMLWNSLCIALFCCYENTIFTIFSQQILSVRLLLAVISGEKSKFSGGFKLEPLTT